MLATKRGFLGVLLLVCMLALAVTCSADTLSIPDGVTAIEEEAFAGSGAQTVVIPSSVQTVGNRAFANCASLTDVYLPANAVEIAADAFDVSETTVFHVYMGSSNATWARERNYQTEYITGDVPTGGSWNQVNTLIATEPIGNKNADRFYTYRLIVKMSSGVPLPDLEVFNPKKVISLDAGRYVLQFNNGTDTEDCYEAFYAMKGKGCEYCEADYFLSYEKDTSEPNTLSMTRSVRSINRNDPMGFSAYTNHIGDDVGKITIAIIDDGVSGSLLPNNNLISSKSYDFIYNSPTATADFGNSHGTKVANAICEAFGTLATSKHLSIISYRIEKPSNGDISYIMMGEAIIQAKLDGANLVNISIAGESSYANDQENEYLEECISYFKGTIVAAAGNRVVPANNHLPARYCSVKAGAAQFINNTDTDLIRADGTATGATISGFATTTSIATARVTAAYALTRLGSHDLSTVLEDVQDGAKMPNLARLVIKPVTAIVLNDGDPIENILWVGDRASIDFEVLPSDATNKNVNVVSENPDIVSILSNNYTSRVRISAIAPGTTRLIFTSDDGNVTVPVTITVIQPVTGVTISGYNGETLMQGQQLELTAIVNPDDASDQTVTWSSSNPDIATVQEPGIITQDDEGRIVNKTTVTQVGEGQVVITATSNFDQTKYAQTEPITVVNEPEPDTVIVLAEGRITSMDIGASPKTVQMHAEVLPEGANQTVTWSVVPESIATIDSTGLLTITGCENPQGRDNVRIYAESYDGKLGYCDIAVIQLPTSITISGANSVPIGETTTLTATVSPSNAANKNVRWTSSHPDIATVTADGTVEGVSAGTAMITAISLADGSIFEAFYVNVAVLPESITIVQPSSTVMDINGTLALSATVSPNNATNKTVTWTSSDTSVATVSASGVVTAKAPGTVTIAVSTFNGKTDTITLTVRQPYTLNFNANGGSCSTSSKTAYSGNPVGSLPTATRTGYTFIGWFRATGESAQVTDSTAITSSSSVTVYAHWRANPYTVLFNANGGTVSTSSKTVTFDSSYGDLPTATRDYYFFNGWFTAANGGSQITNSTKVTITSTQTLYAHWSPYPLTVTFNTNLSGATCSTATKTCYVDTAIGTLPTPSKTGYTFNGWFTSASGGTQVAATQTYANDSAVTLYAHWTKITYTVTLNNQSATTAGSTSVKATYDTAMPSITKPARTGYTFGGYYTAQNGGGTQYYTAAGASARNWNIASNTTLYAYWTGPNNYTYNIVYKSSNGTALGTSTITKTFGTTNTVTPPAKAGYTTPSAQNVVWDATSKTITFTYTPTTVAFTTKTGNFFSNGHIKYSAELQYQNRTATSVQIRVAFSLIRNSTAYDIMRISFYGSCSGVSIPTTTIVPFNAWKSASSTDTKRTGTSEWITVPLTTTDQTTLDVKVECWQYNSNGTKMTDSSYARINTTWTMNIPAY